MGATFQQDSCGELSIQRGDTQDLSDKVVNPDMYQSLFAVTKSSSAVYRGKFLKMIAKHKMVYIVC